MYEHLVNKIKANDYFDEHPKETHIDALRAVGCESDIRNYDAAVRFLKCKLNIKSLKLYTNNPRKIKAVEKYYDSNLMCQSMPGVPGTNNDKHLKEKVEHLGHNEELLGGPHCRIIYVVSGKCV